MLCRALRPEAEPQERAKVIRVPPDDDGGTVQGLKCTNWFVGVVVLGRVSKCAALIKQFSSRESRLLSFTIKVGLDCLEVKILKESVQATLRQEAAAASFKRMKSKVFRDTEEKEYVPAVEVHMYPKDPMNVIADWEVLALASAV